MGSSDPTAKVVAWVWRRDDGRCARCGRGIHGERGRDWSIHHRVPRGSGGAKHVPWINLPGNLLLLCGSGTTGCHGWIEGNRAEAIDLGYLVSRLGRTIPVDVPVHHAIRGLVLLDDEGGYRELGEAA